MTNRARPILIWLAVLLMALCLLLIQRGQKVRPQKLNQPLASLDLALGQWRALGPDQKLDQATLALLKPQDYLLRNYMDPSRRRCALFVAYFGLQEEGRMIHSPRNCLPGSGWQITSRKQVRVPGPGGGYLVNHLILGKQLSKLSVLYWYQGRGKVQYNEYLERLSLVMDGIFLNRSDGALVRLTSAMDPKGGPVLPRQIQLASALIPALERLLPASGPAR